MITRKVDRARQSSWLLPGSMIKQDQELIDFVKATAVTEVLGIGDIDFFRSFFHFVDRGPVDLCVMIQNSDFDLDQLLHRVNQVIDEDLAAGGQLYLSLNKYLIRPRRYAANLPADFDQAIGAYVSTHVQAEIIKYLPCGLDYGNKFNWVHPLTRFYIGKTHDS